MRGASVTRERDFAKQVEHLLTVNHWLWKHDEPAMRPGGRYVTALSGSKGFPDYIAVRGHRLIVAEIKSDTGRLTPGQKEWLERLEQVPNVECYVWRPQHLQTVRDTLR